ncbi:hypothetical protein HMPREF1433_00562 [Helicobacter pylori GAMchJs117Ai]|nr:hypothetical protein HMPREF1407_00444 [Helicobacter pylori GAM244Ai]EMJ41084.1 hypothetical protein HMPREF1433_00562 [Helicobacter pylori GAMchJs117Ai]EMJ43615.1 hypothetical protein HMPREF1434_00957 [Helicobacter pylori GAMchJs124i]
MSQWSLTPLMFLSNVFIAPLKSSFFIIHLIISVHFKIEPF